MKVCILFPVYNDWDALHALLHKIKEHYTGQWADLKFLAVNDCSPIPYPKENFSEFNIQILELNCNLSHQRAIAVGLSYLANEAQNLDYVVVMDADGEDQPEHINKLLQKTQTSPGQIIFAERKKRTESFVFRAFYIVYKMIFKLLTGNVINFGNFSVIPFNMLKKLCFVSEIWNNYPGGVIRSKLPLGSIPLDRGQRLAGKSKMNFTSLIIHGMSAISVFLDFTAVRILMAILLMIPVALIGVGVVLYIKFILNQATPGWATTALFAFSSVILQCFIIALFILFMVLSSRRYTSFIPYLGYKMYIDKLT